MSLPYWNEIGSYDHKISKFFKSGWSPLGQT
jgi:hypothetical protein